MNMQDELAKMDAFMEAYYAMPIAARVAFHRPGILQQCVRWRQLIGSGAKGDINPVEMLKWQQGRLASLRSWRETGKQLSVH